MSFNDKSDELNRKLPKSVLERYADDIKNSPVRKLTPEERNIYSAAVVKAMLFVPAFRDTMALLRPFMDAKAGTAYTDQYSRVGLSYWFFYSLNLDQQASVLLHECMHVLNNHFSRGEDLVDVKKHGKILNIAGDFEINSTLCRVTGVDLNVGILPHRKPYDFPPNKLLEFYVPLLLEKAKEDCEACSAEAAEAAEAGDSSQAEDGSTSGSDTGEAGESGGAGESGAEGDGAASDTGGGAGQAGQGAGQSQSGSGKGASKAPHTCGEGAGWGCDESNEATEEAADAAGIPRASEVEQAIAKANTAARILDEKNSGARGTGASNEFWDSILQHLSPPKVDWRKILRRVVASSVDSLAKGRADYTYKRTSRRLQHADFVFPGMVDYKPRIAIGVDTSGSMGNEDYQLLLNEIEALIKKTARGKDAVSVFSVDTKVGGIAPVSSVKRLKLSGGGGTQMAVAIQYLKGLTTKEQPDVFVLTGDGYWDWRDIVEELQTAKFKTILCITQHGGFLQAPPHVKQLATVVDISSDE